MDLKRKLEELVLENLKNENLFLLDILISGGEGAQKVLVLLDGDEGVDIDECALLSRKLGEEIESQELISNAYILEVSSPGLDYPLQNLRQYKKNVGRNIKTTLLDEKIIKGKLLEVNEDVLKIGEEIPSKVKGKAPEIKEIEIPFQNIKKTNVLASFK